MNEKDFKSMRRGLAQAETFKMGNREGYAVHEPVDVKAIRAATNKTQAEFATTYHLPIGTLRDWEQNRRQPDTPARVLLSIIQRDPEAVERLIAAV